MLEGRMSFDLCVFHTEKPHSDDDAIDRYSAYCGDDDFSPWIEPSPKVAAFLKDLTAQYPDIDDVPAQNVDDCPWAAGLDLSEGHVVMPMVFSWAERMYPVVLDLAEKHSLVCFDPQQGKIVAAPPGIHVEKTKEPPVVVPDNPKNPAKPLADTLKELLKPLGFERKGRYWRKDADKAVISLEPYNDEGNYEVAFYAWFKELGDVDPAKVKSGGDFHLYRQLDGDFLPERNLFRLQRAFGFGHVYIDSLPRLYGTELAKQLMAHYEPRELLTLAWRAEELRRTMKDYVLPFFERIEAGEHKAIVAEEEARRERERQNALAAEIERLKTLVARCRQWTAEGVENSDLIRNLQRELLIMPSVAIVLCAAFGCMIEKAKKLITASGVWSIEWRPEDDADVQDDIDTYGCFVMHDDGRIELV